jgi:histidinol-phosphate aminotransferase
MPQERFFVSESIRSVAPYVPGKPIEETQREYGLKKVIKLASNENPLGPSPKGMAAVKKAVKELHRYPDASGFRLKQALAKHLKVSPRELALGNGSNDVIDTSVRTFCAPGDAIVTSQAAFLAYKLSAQIHGVRAIETPLTADLRFDLGAMLRAVREDARVRMVFVANPNNPTGTYLTRDELRSFLADVAQVRGGSVLVGLDYAYWEYVTARDLPDPLELYREFSNVIVFRTFSKVYGLSGLRSGYGVAAPDVIASMEKVRQPFNLNSLALAAAEAALGDRAFVARARKTNLEGMRFWSKELRKLGVPFWPSQGNFLLINAKEGLGLEAAQVYQESLKRGVILRPVANYGLHDALRISVGTMAENRAALKVLRQILKSGVRA